MSLFLMNKVFIICIIILFNFSSCATLDLIIFGEEDLSTNTTDFDSPDPINLPSDIVSQWKLESVRIGIYEDFIPIVNNDKTPTLGISGDGRIGGHDGCNGYSGKIVMDNSKNIMFSDLLSTRRGCPPDVYWHDKFYKALSQINNYAAQNNKLLLKNDSHVLMVFSKINRVRCGNELKNDR